MQYKTYRRGSNTGSIKHKLIIPFDEINQIAPASRTPFMIESEKAYGFRVNGINIWGPKSQIDDFHYRFSDHEAHIEFYCPKWLIEEKSLELFINTAHEPGLFDEQPSDPDYSDLANTSFHGD